MYSVIQFAAHAQKTGGVPARRFLRQLWRSNNIEERKGIACSVTCLQAIFATGELSGWKGGEDG